MVFLETNMMKDQAICLEAVSGRGQRTLSYREKSQGAEMQFQKVLKSKILYLGDTTLGDTLSSGQSSG